MLPDAQRSESATLASRYGEAEVWVPRALQSPFYTSQVACVQSSGRLVLSSKRAWLFIVTHMQLHALRAGPCCTNAHVHWLAGKLGNSGLLFERRHSMHMWAPQCPHMSAAKHS